MHSSRETSGAKVRPGFRLTAESRRDILICAFLAVAVVLGTIPFVEMGVNDDFSYTQIALHLANTGKFLYNGWNTPMLGFQAYWAALFIKIFGFSFTLVRLSTLPFVIGTASVLYMIAVYAEIPRHIALMYALFVAASPLSLPLEASFMTDIPALFFLLVAFMATLRATDERASPAASVGWIAVIGTAGLIGGSIRQVVWLVPGAFLPYVVFSCRRKWIRFASFVCWCAVLGLALTMMRWFSAQPFSTIMPLFPSFLVGFRATGVNLAGMILEFLILVMPITALFWRTGWRTSLSWRVFLTGSAVFLAAAAIWAPAFHLRVPSLPFAYFPANLVSENGIFLSSVEILGTKPRILPRPIQFALLTTAILFAGLTLRVLLPLWTRSLAGLRQASDSRSRPSRATHLCLLFSALYALLLISRSLEGLAMDRYLIPLLALVTLPLILWLPEADNTSRRLSRCFIVLFAFYAIASTHNYFAESRARLLAAEGLAMRHVPRQNITAGAEFDGWTELRMRGYLNDSRIAIPPRAYVHPVARVSRVLPPYWFWEETPDVKPMCYVAVSSLESGLEAVPGASVEYTAWLPPFKRHVYVECDETVLTKNGAPTPQDGR